MIVSSGGGLWRMRLTPESKSSATANHRRTLQKMLPTDCYDAGLQETWSRDLNKSHSAQSQPATRLSLTIRGSSSPLKVSRLDNFHVR